MCNRKTEMLPSAVYVPAWCHTVTALSYLWMYTGRIHSVRWNLKEAAADVWELSDEVSHSMSKDHHLIKPRVCLLGKIIRNKGVSRWCIRYKHDARILFNICVSQHMNKLMLLWTCLASLKFSFCLVCMRPSMRVSDYLKPQRSARTTGCC